MEELTTLARTDTPRHDLKNSALFSALTGLRFSDVSALTWQQIQHTGEDYAVRLRVQKTQRSETIPITDEARELLGEVGEPTARIFPKLNYSKHLNDYPDLRQNSRPKETRCGKSSNVRSKDKY